MSGDSGLIPLEQIGHLVCSEPYCIVRQRDFYLGLPIRRLIQNNASSTHCRLILIWTIPDNIAGVLMEIIDTRSEYLEFYQ